MRGASRIWFSLHTQFLPLNPHSTAEGVAVDTVVVAVGAEVAVVVEAAATAAVDPAGAQADPLAEPRAAEEVAE